MRWTILLVLSIAIFFSACSTLGPQNAKSSVVFERDGVSTLLMPSATREVYFKSLHSDERHCRAPGPDFTVQDSSGVSLGVSLAGENEGVTDSSGQAALSLGGRNPSLLLTRELLYRACELASNLNADQNTTIEIYNNFFKLVEKSIELQQSKGTAPVSDSAQSTLKVNENISDKSNNSISSKNNSDSTGDSSSENNSDSTDDSSSDYNSDSTDDSSSDYNSDSTGDSSSENNSDSTGDSSSENNSDSADDSSSNYTEN